MRVVVFGAAGWLGRSILQAMAGKHTLKTVDHSPAAWGAWEDVGPPWEGERVCNEIQDFAAVDKLIVGADAVIHAAAYFGNGEDDPLPWLINLKGLWNVLEACRRHAVRRVVHVGSREVAHPSGIFFDAEVRRPGGNVYATTKRLQEELCRSYWDAHRVRTIVLAPDYIVDSHLGIGRFREPLGPPASPTQPGWVCRSDMAEACRLAAENDTLDFDIFPIAGTPEAANTCSVDRSRSVLGLCYRADLAQFRDRCAG